MSWERWRIRAVVGGLLTALAVTGCGGKSGGDDDDDDDDASAPSCKSICDDLERAACPDTDTSMCVSDCNKVEHLAEAAMCSDFWGQYLECYDGIPDKCAVQSGDTACKVESDRISACLLPYCMDPDNSAICSVE